MDPTSGLDKRVVCATRFWPSLTSLVCCSDCEAHAQTDQHLLTPSFPPNPHT